MECNIAEKILALRVEKGVTQEEVAKSLLVSNKTVSKWENGISMPDLSMVVALARYFGVSTDMLLGLSDETKQTTEEVVRAGFDGLDWRGAVLKAFDTVRSIIPAIFGTVVKRREDVSVDGDVIPCENPRCGRSQVASREMFSFVVSTADVNLAVMQLRNKSDFAWLREERAQQKITRLFRFLAEVDALSVLWFVHSTACSENFTADYVAKHTGVAQARVAEILNEFCSVGACRRRSAVLETGEITLYKSFGDGVLLSLIALAYEQTCGRPAYDYNYQGTCKMIGGNGT